jgi:acyl carrier protein
MTSEEARTLGEIQDWLVSQLAGLTGIDRAEIDVHEAFDSYGLASREAVMLSGDLEEWLGRRLSPILVYEYPTIESLARHLAVDGASSPAREERGEDELEGILMRLEEASEDEVEALLLERLAALDED